MQMEFGHVGCRTYSHFPKSNYMEESEVVEIGTDQSCVQLIAISM